MLSEIEKLSAEDGKKGSGRGKKLVEIQYKRTTDLPSAYRNEGSIK